MITAKFQDLYAGLVDMEVVSFKTTVRGARILRYRWAPVSTKGCVTTGFKSSGFATERSAMNAAYVHARFSEVRFVEERLTA